jgi:hypothetical protein
MAVRSIRGFKGTKTPASSSRKPKPAAKVSVKKAEDEFLAKVMVGVSASLEAMTDQERERAVAAAERSVAHL